MQTMEIIRMNNSLVHKLTLLTRSQRRHILDDYNKEIEELYDAIYNNKKLPLSIMYDFDNYMNSAEDIYEKQTFDEYVEQLLQGATRSEYVNFLRNYHYYPSFKNNLYKKYQKNENMKSIKNRLFKAIHRHL